MANTFVHIEGNAYRVLFQGNLKEDHLVSKNRTCSCGEKDCLAIKEVEIYLRNGGRRAPDPLPPCPICGSEVITDRSLDGKYTHEPGWRCTKGGKKHFFQAKAKKIQENMAKHPYLFKPVPEDNYPGVRMDELTTWQECQEISKRVYQETGYNPTM